MMVRRRRFYAVVQFFHKILELMEPEHHKVKDQVCIKYDLISACLKEIKRLEGFKGPANEAKKYKLLALLYQCLCLRDLQDLERQDVEEDDVRPMTDFEM